MFLKRLWGLQFLLTIVTFIKVMWWDVHSLIICRKKLFSAISARILFLLTVQFRAVVFHIIFSGKLMLTNWAQIISLTLKGKKQEFEEKMLVKKNKTYINSFNFKNWTFRQLIILRNRCSGHAESVKVARTVLFLKKKEHRKISKSSQKRKTKNTKYKQQRLFVCFCLLRGSGSISNRRCPFFPSIYII